MPAASAICPAELFHLGKAVIATSTSLLVVTSRHKLKAMYSIKAKALSHLLAGICLASHLLTAAAQTPAAPGMPATPTASASFCLFEVAPQTDRRTFLNLGIVQYVELRTDELRIYYGGGNLGSGHEFRLPLRDNAEGEAYLQRMQATALNGTGK